MASLADKTAVATAPGLRGLPFILALIVVGAVIFGFSLLLAGFLAIRGRIRIESGRSGHRIRRFNGIERFAHWLLAVSFIILGLTGLNITYGKLVVMPVLGQDAFAAEGLAVAELERGRRARAEEGDGEDD